MSNPAPAESFSALLHADRLAYGMRHHSAFATFGYLFTNPGFLAGFLYRASAYFRVRGGMLKFMGCLCWRLNILLSGCYFSPLAVIGGGLCLPHPTGIVVGEGVVIGRQATIYQQVTLGLRHARGGVAVAVPVLGDGVKVFSGAVLLGSIRVGDGASVGANAVLLQDVPAGAAAVGNPARILPTAQV